MNGLKGAAAVAALNRERAEDMSPLRAWSCANWSSVRWSEEKEEEEVEEEEFEEVEELEEIELELGFFFFIIPARRDCE